MHRCANKFGQVAPDGAPPADLFNIWRDDYMLTPADAAAEEQTRTANAFFDGVLPPFSNIGNTVRGSTIDSPTLRGIGRAADFSTANPTSAYDYNAFGKVEIYNKDILANPITGIYMYMYSICMYVCVHKHPQINPKKTKFTQAKGPRMPLRRPLGVPRAMTLTPPARLPTLVAGVPVRRRTRRGVSTHRPPRARARARSKSKIRQEPQSKFFQNSMPLRTGPHCETTSASSPIKAAPHVTIYIS